MVAAQWQRILGDSSLRRNFANTIALILCEPEARSIISCGNASRDYTGALYWILREGGLKRGCLSFGGCYCIDLRSIGFESGFELLACEFLFLEGNLRALDACLY